MRQRDSTTEPGAAEAFALQKPIRQCGGILDRARCRELLRHLG
jgi:hypothetical protein